MPVGVPRTNSDVDVGIGSGWDEGDQSGASVGVELEDTGGAVGCGTGTREGCGTGTAEGCVVGRGVGSRVGAAVYETWNVAESESNTSTQERLKTYVFTESSPGTVAVALPLLSKVR